MMKNQGRFLKVLFNLALVCLTGLVGASALASQPEAVPGEYIVKLKPALGIMSFKKQQLSSALGSYVKNTIPEANIVVVKRAVFENEKAAIKALAINPLVEYAEPNYIYRASRVPNDPMLIKLWGLNNSGQADAQGNAGVAGVDIDAEKAWDIETGSDKVIVAVIDTGIDYNHPDLKDNVWTNEVEAKGKPGVDDDNNGYIDDIHGYNFSDSTKPTPDPLDDHGHGSHCSGTIGASGNDGKGIVGINWKVKIMAVKFLSAEGSGSLEGAIMAIDYATKMGAKIMSNSWGGGGFSQALLEAIQRANAAGAVFVAAAGNESNNNDSNPTYPASYDVPNMIAVAALDSSGNLASFSNYGKRTVHLGAPGVDIYSSVKNGGYDTMSGTSMATPHVSGVAALLAAHEPNLTNVQIKERLIKSVKPMTQMSGKTISGGMVSAYNALENIQAPPDLNDPSNWATQSLSLESAHPYKEKTKETYTVKVPGAKEFALYFEHFETERNYDTLTIKDSAGAVVAKLSGNNNESFSPTVKGDSATLEFVSDESVQGYGWGITKAAYR